MKRREIVPSREGFEILGVWRSLYLLEMKVAGCGNRVKKVWR